MRVRLLNLSSSALRRLRHLGETKNKSLFINVTGGGCSGFQYNFRLVGTSTPQRSVWGHPGAHNHSGAKTDSFGSAREDESGEEEPAEDETVLVYEEEGIRVFSDPESTRLIEGCTLDFQEELIGSKFVLEDIQNAIRKCSCGNSFDLKDP